MCPALYANPAKDEWPDEFRELSGETQTMYRHAVANRAVLQIHPMLLQLR